MSVARRGAAQLQLLHGATGKARTATGSHSYSITTTTSKRGWTDSTSTRSARCYWLAGWLLLE